MSRRKIPLVFDLDGTLIKGDCLYEAIAEISLHKPWLAPGLLVAFLNRGKAGLKTRASEITGISGRNIPWQTECIALLKKEKQSGRICIMATASPARWAEEINGLLGNPFEEILSSSPERNLSGETKAEALKSRFGPQKFDYVGDSRADLPVWNAAKKAYVVGSDLIPNVPTEQLSKKTQVSWPEALRTHQWAKNLLIFVPLIAGHAYGNPQSVGLAMGAFLAFCLAASGNYLLNDIWDADKDRAHPTKANRQIASGALPIPKAFLLATALIFCAGILALWVGPAFSAALLCYLIGAAAYSHWGKRIPMLDAIGLSALYCTRIWAGGAATGLEISSWLLSASIFLFFSLALGKRDAELATQKTTSRGYQEIDRASLSGLGAGSGLAACTMLFLYVKSPEANHFYGGYPLLWIAPCLAIFWISRFWLLCGRGKMGEDPVVWALKDRATWACGAVIGAAFTLARMLNAS